jgi:hypothetical protein
MRPAVEGRGCCGAEATAAADHLKHHPRVGCKKIKLWGSLQPCLSPQNSCGRRLLLQVLQQLEDSVSRQALHRRPISPIVTLPLSTDFVLCLNPMLPLQVLQQH